LWPIVLQASFCLTDARFSGLYARRSNVDVGNPLHSVTNWLAMGKESAGTWNDC
jgi:hypothetical protein